jgi:hypothetical protein
MKKLILILFFASILLAWQSLAFSGNFGSPNPAAVHGGFALGVGYLHNESKWEPEDDSFLGISYIWKDDAETKSDRVYVQGSFSFLKNWEVYARFGAADMRVENAFSDLADFKGDYEPFGTVGIRGLFYNGGSWGIGPFAQANYVFTDFENDFSTLGIIDGMLVHASGKRKYENPRDISAGVAFYMKRGIINFYGGPFLYWGKADTEDDIELIDVETDTLLPASGSTTYEEKGNLGGYLGVQASLGKSFNLEVEAIAKKRIGFGTALTYSF